MIIDGKKIAGDIIENIKNKTINMNRKPCLAVILVGNNPASISYIKSKEKACHECCIESIFIHLKEDATESDVISKIYDLDEDDTVDGILVQLPLPSHINKDHILDIIYPEKDVDGFTAENMGKLISSRECFIPCTPLGIKEMMKRYISEGNSIKNVVVIGRSNIVGIPLVNILERKDMNMTVTWCHTGTDKYYMYDKIQEADCVVVATGCVNTFDYHYIKPGSLLIDVGINRIPDKTKKSGFRLVGDVYDSSDSHMKDFFDKNNISYTPIPGGVGPMTVAMLMNNVLESYNRKV